LARGRSPGAENGTSYLLPGRWIRAAAILLVSGIAVAALLTGRSTAGRSATPRLIVKPWSQPLPFPAGVAYLPDGRALVTEKDTGTIRMVDRNGRVRRKPFAHLQVFSGAEYGLLTIAVDPQFKRFPFVYVYYVQPTANGKAARRARLVRFRFRNGVGTGMRVLVDNVATNKETIHVGGAMVFKGNYLLLAVGDGSPSRADSRSQKAQDLSSREGKILRLTRDGRPAPGDPFRDGILTLGHRNSYGLTIDRRTGAIFESENGPDQSDEVNRIVAGRNYGWPVCEGIARRCQVSGKYADPLWETGLHTVALTGIVSYHGTRIPALHDTVTVCGFKDGALYSLRLSRRQTSLVSVTRYTARGWRCGAALVEGPDGLLSFTDQTSGRVMRIVGSS
jgi:glucose/arabinose dehydrogenase